MIERLIDLYIKVKGNRELFGIVLESLLLKSSYYRGRGSGKKGTCAYS